MQGVPAAKVDWLNTGSAKDQQPLYLCADCGKETRIKPRDRLKCEFCHGNILYKLRTKRVLCFEAR